MVNTIPVRRSLTAKKFLEALAGISSKKNAQYGDLGFRGQADAGWPLVPSAFRNIHTAVTPSAAISKRRLVDQAKKEFNQVANFFQLADTVGLPVPQGGSIFLNTHNGASSLPPSFWSDWPNEEFLESLAIAQHHNVPTRLLDFTYDWSTAAFFSAWDAVENTSSQIWLSPTISVWCVDLRFVRRAWDRGSVENRRIREVTVPRATNQYLYAQRGIFLVDMHLEDYVKSILKLDDVLLEWTTFWSHKEGFWSRAMSKSMLVPTIEKFTVPRSEALQVLRLLHQRGLSAASLMPSYEGVYRAIQLKSIPGIT